MSMLKKLHIKKQQKENLKYSPFVRSDVHK